MRLLRLFFGVLGSVLGVGALAMVLLHVFYGFRPGDSGAGRQEAS